MKLFGQSSENWQYYLDEKEADILLGLVRKFPFLGQPTVEISKTDSDAHTGDREKLLAESLTEHKKELKKLVADVLGENVWTDTGQGRLLTLTPELREVLLQVLNDIRVGCWYKLGKPEVLEEKISRKDFTCRYLMDLAGYFEMGLLGAED